MALARWQATITDEAGNIIASPQVEVRAETAGAPLARLYTDRAGTVQAANPITGDANGYVYFHVTGGAYRITATKGAFSRTWRYVGIGRNSESDLAGLRPQGAWAADFSYSSSDYIRHNERTFVSLVDENLGNEPPDAPEDDEFWMWVPLGENAELAIDAREAAEAQAGYAEEWAQSEDPISVPAGGDGSTDQSAKTWAGESAGSAADASASAAVVAGLATAFVIAENTFATKAAAQAWTPVAGPDYIRIAGYTAAGDGGGALYKKVVAEPSHEGKFSITLSGGGGTVWYELAEVQPTPQMFGAKADGVTDDTTAITRLLAFSRDCFLPAGTYLVSTVAIPANTRVRTAGFSTVIKQKSGTAVGTRVITIGASNVQFALEGVKFTGNISTDTNEQNHCVYIGGASFSDVRVGDVIGQDIRGDVVYIGTTSANPLYRVSIGNVTGNNVLRNVVSITGGQQIDVGHVTGNAVGYLMFDVEPDPGAHRCDQISVKSVRGHSVGVVGTQVQKLKRIGRVAFGSLDLSPNYTADSTPAYGHRATITLDGLQLRNCESVRVGQYRARDFNRSPIFVTWNAGEYGVGDLDIGEIDFEDCILTDTTYRALIVAASMRNLRIGGGYARVNGATHRVMLLDSTGIGSTSKTFTSIDVALETNGSVAFGARAGRVRVKLHPAAGRVLHTVRAASTTNVAISTLATGGSIDGVTMATNDLVLLKDQTTGTENGIYRVNAAGPATRYVGADASAEFVESYVYVREGTTNIRKYFYCTNSSDPTLGTTAIAYAEDVPYAQYAFSNCSDITITDSDIIFGRPGADCTNFTIQNTNWRNTVATWNQFSLADGSLHTLISTTFDGVLTPLGTATRTYRRTIRFGTQEVWVDSTGKLRVKSSAPTSETDGTVVGTQT